MSGADAGGGAITFKKKKRRKKKQTKALKPSLTFEDDHEEEPGADAFVLKKSTKTAQPGDLVDAKRERHKKRKAKAKRRAKQRGLSALGSAADTGGRSQYGGLMQSSAGMYTPDALNKLRSNAIHIKSSSSSNERSTGPRPPQQQSAQSSNSSGDAVGMEMDEQEEEEDSAVGIASKDEVEAARRKRERMRAMGGVQQRDFIPLAGGGPPSSSAGSAVVKYGDRATATESGLVQEDDDDLEEAVFQDHQHNRIHFGDPGRRGPSHRVSIANQIRDAERRRRTGASASAPPTAANGTVSMADDDDEDDTFRRWEAEQIRKGGVKQPQRPQRTPARAPPAAASAPKPPNWSAPKGDAGNVNIDLLLKSLQSVLTDLRSEQAAKTQQLKALDVELEEAKQKVITLGSDMEHANEQYVFFQRVRDDVCDLLDCLAVKAPLVEDAMEELLDIHAQLAKAQAESVSLHMHDRQAEAFGSERKDKGANTVRRVDEFGRDIDDMVDTGKTRRKQKREARASMRKAASSAAAQPLEHGPGWESDDEIEEDVSPAYHDKIRILRQEAPLIFADAGDKFQSFDAVQDVLEQWKTRYEQSYTDAFISLSVPAMAAPFVRLEVVSWNPLELTSFDNMKWYRKLLSFGVHDNTPMDDEDYHLVPRLVEKVVVPRIVNCIKYQWRTSSLETTRKLVAVVQETMVHIQDLTGSTAIDALRSAVRERLQRAANLHIRWRVVPTSAASAEQREFCQRQWWRAAKLLAVILQCKDVLGAQGVQALACSHMADSLLPLLKHALDSKATSTLPALLQQLSALHRMVPTAWVSAAAKAARARDPSPVELALLQYRAFARRLVEVLGSAGSLSAQQALQVTALRRLCAAD